jgi:hypothetical protein
MDKNIIIKKINENWDKIKKESVEYWKDFTTEQVEILNDYESLAAELKAIYKFSDAELDREIEKFMDKLGLIPIEMHVEQLKKVLYQSTCAATMKITKVLEQSADRIKDTSGEFQQLLAKYVKKYPLKSICISFLCGIFIKKLLNKKQ